MLAELKRPKETPDRVKKTLKIQRLVRFALSFVSRFCALLLLICLLSCVRLGHLFTMDLFGQLSKQVAYSQLICLTVLSSCHTI